MNLQNTIKDLQEKKIHPIIFISGMAGSGKTTLAKELAEKITNAKHFELDWYLSPSIARMERIREVLESESIMDKNLVDQVLNPVNWYDWDSFKSDLATLQKEGRVKVKNALNKITREKDTECIVDFNGKSGAILCDADFVLHPPIISMADFVVLIDASLKETFQRLKKRDKHYKGSEDLERKRIITERYDVPYFKTYRENADIVLSST